jgi:hypothetical protein
MQVASHAQKYFLLRSNLNRCRRRRSSPFDITTDKVLLLLYSPSLPVLVSEKKRTEKKERISVSEIVCMVFLFL